MTEQGKEEKNLEWAMGHMFRPRIMFSLFCQIEICALTKNSHMQFYILAAKKIKIKILKTSAKFLLLMQLFIVLCLLNIYVAVWILFSSYLREPRK